MNRRQEEIELRSSQQPNNVQPVISICCTTYQHVNYITDAIEGFLKQRTNFAVEIIIRDDASKDGTSEIVAEYAAKYPTLILPILKKENLYTKGIKPMRDCLNYASGKYIALCEGDDYWTDPYKLQKQVDFLEANPEFSGSFHETTMLSDGKMIGKIFGKNAPDVVNPVDTISLWSLFHTSSFIFRKSAYFIPDGIEKIFSGDMALFSLVSKSGPIKKNAGQMSVYRKHAGGITATTDKTVRFYTDRIVLMHFLNKIHEYKYNEKVQKIINEFKKVKSNLIPKPFLTRIKGKLKKTIKKLIS